MRHPVWKHQQGRWCQMGGAVWLLVAYRGAGVCRRRGEAHSAGGQGTGDRAFLGSRRRYNLAFINTSPEDLAATSIHCRRSGLEAGGEVPAGTGGQLTLMAGRCGGPSALPRRAQGHLGSHLTCPPVSTSVSRHRRSLWTRSTQPWWSLQEGQ